MMRSPALAVLVLVLSLGWVGALPGGGARIGVVQRLFPGLKPLQGVFRANRFAERRQFVLRYRLSEQRAEVERLAREIDALEARVGQGSTASQEAREARVRELRKEAGVAELYILNLKAKMGQAGLTRPGPLGMAARMAETFTASEERSARVLFSQLRRRDDPWALLREDTEALLRLGSNLNLTRGYVQLPQSQRLLPHTAAIFARASRLEQSAPGILLAVDGHLDVVEPHMDAILERFDQIEPHLPFILSHIDELAPYCGVLLEHFDGLLLYGDEEEDCLVELIGYLPVFAPQLNALGAHIGLIRPHLRKLLPHLPAIAPHASRFARYCSISANADVVLFYFGWLLRLPLIGRRILGTPGVPRIASFLSRRLPRWPVRGRTAGYVCEWEECESEYLRRAAKKRRGVRWLRLRSSDLPGHGQKPLDTLDA